MSGIPHDADSFLTTRWTRVCLAKEASEDGRRALADLCAAYYEPVVVFLGCKMRDAAAARELSHAFFEQMAYAAPEQQSGPADHRADIYSLGVVLYEMLTGERPKDRLEPPLRRVQVDVRIDEIVLRALENSPEMRFATAAEFRTQVEVVRSSLAPSARWSPLKWAALSIAAVTVASAAYTVSQNRSPKGPTLPISNTVRPSIATLPEAAAKFETTYDELLHEERAAAVPEASATADDAARHARRLFELRAEAAELERLILTLAQPSPVPAGKLPAQNR